MRMRKQVFSLGFALAAFVCGAQDSVYTTSYLKKSTRFAATTLSVDVLALGGGRVGPATDFSNTFVPRVSIGGIHFWGHADFYVTFPLSFAALHQPPTGVESLTYRAGIETGLRVYPWAIKPRSVRPFVGFSRRLLTYSKELADVDYGYGAAVYQRTISPWQLGMTYTTSRYIISLSAYYQHFQEANYFVSPSQQSRVRFDPWALNLSFSWYWDTDKGYATQESVAQLNAMYNILKKENKLSSWYWGIGPSAALQMSRSSFFEINLPYLAGDFIGGITPDITFGRFFDKPDMNVGLSFRAYRDRVQAFGDDIRLYRQSFMLESYKNLFDWLGFVPFVGATASVERLGATINGERYLEVKPALGFIFGWDIRVTKTGTSLLRTNLRYIPNLHLNVEADQIMFDHLEFNFIQYVTFIGRKKVYRKYQNTTE